MPPTAEVCQHHRVGQAHPGTLKSSGSQSLTLDTIIDWSQKAVGGTAAGIFLLHAKGKLETAVPTSAGMARAHELQIELNEGPCLQVINDDNVDTYVIGDTATDIRFPT